MQWSGKELCHWWRLATSALARFHFLQHWWLRPILFGSIVADGRWCVERRYGWSVEAFWLPSVAAWRVVSAQRGGAQVRGSKRTSGQEFGFFGSRMMCALSSSSLAIPLK
jgi:hypothetical protein